MEKIDEKRGRFLAGKYLRCLELFAVVHEEMGEAQKAFNDWVWKWEGNSNSVIKELEDLDSPLKELKSTLKEMGLWRK